MVNYSMRLDGVFAALADPTRRAIVERLSRAPVNEHSTLELAPTAGGTKLTHTESGALLDGYDGADDRVRGTKWLLDQLEAPLRRDWRAPRTCGRVPCTDGDAAAGASEFLTRDASPTCSC